MKTKRTFLIVEDDAEFSDDFKDYCEEAARELDIGCSVEVANSLSSAHEILARGANPDFVSLDLALDQGEKNLRDADRSAGKDAGGMLLLKELQKAENPPLAIIVSGESNISYPIEALQTYGVLAYISKSKISKEIYKGSVKAVLYYLHSLESLTLFKEALPELDTITNAEKYWEQALKEAEKAGIAKDRFPGDLGQKIETLHDTLFDPNTKLPLSQLTEHKLREKVVGKTGWSLIQIRVKNLDKFRTAYASQIKPLLFGTSVLFSEILGRFKLDDAFMGFLDLEYTPEPRIVIVLGAEDAARLADIKEALQSEFDKKAENYLGKAELSEIIREELRKDLGDRLHTLSYEQRKAEERQILSKLVVDLSPRVEIATLCDADDYFTDLHELLDTLGQSSDSKST